MQQCPNCHATQQQGKFCGKCGTPIVSEMSTIVPVQPTPEQPSVEQPTISAQSTNVQVEKLKEFSNGYFSHFIELLKQPTQALTMKTSFLNSILSFILYLFILSYTIYTMINKVYGSTLGGFSDFGVLTVNVTKASSETLFQKIITLVQTAQSEMSPSQQFIERFENTYVKGVLIVVALMLFLPHYLLGWDWTTTFYRAMVLLVVASPCALVAAIMPATL